MNDEADIPFADVAAASKRVAQRVIEIGENRVELLMVEVQEARERLLNAFLVALGMAVFGLLFGVALTIGVVILFWEHNPLAAIAILALLYAAAGIALRVRLGHLQRDWQSVPAILDQLRKDCECLGNTIH
jgi:uncharacterized membrane protein YqjE